MKCTSDAPDSILHGPSVPRSAEPGSFGCEASNTLPLQRWKCLDDERREAAVLRDEVPLPEGRVADRLRAATLFELAGLAAIFGATVYVFVILSDSMSHNGPGGDEGYFSWGGWCILKGLVPYREFLDFKPPMVFITHALAQKLYGIQDSAYRKFFVLFPLGSIVLFQLSLLSRRIDKWVTMALGLALIHLWVNSKYHDTALSDAESIGLAYYFFGVAFLLARLPYRHVTRALGGAFLTLCAFSKEPYGPCILLTWVTCFLMEEGIGDGKRRFLQYLRDTGVGVAIALVGLVTFMAPTGALRAYIAMARR